MGGLLDILGTINTAKAQRDAGAAAQQSANMQALQMEQQASQEKKVSEIEANQRRREAELAISNTRARAAAGGGGASDPSIAKLTSEIAGRGEYNALAALYNGETKSLDLQYQADVTRVDGQNARIASKIKSTQTILEGASRTADRLGPAGDSYD